MLRFRAIADKLGANSMSALAGAVPTGERSLRHILQAGLIRQVHKEWGGFRSPLGTRLSAVSFGPQGEAKAAYRGGDIKILAKGVVEVKQQWELEVRFRGFECLEQSNEVSKTDEPYFIISVVHPQGSRTHLLGPYEYVDDEEGKDRRAADHELIAGVSPEATAISIVVREHDHGTPEEAKERVQGKIMEIGNAISQAAALSEDAEGADVAPSWSKSAYIGYVAEGLAAIFGMGDDTVGETTRVILDDPAGWRDEDGNWLSPAILGKFEGNDYNYVTPVLGDSSEGRYRAYLLVRIRRQTTHVWPGTQLV